IDPAAFEVLDREFLADYASARNDLIARQGPIILANFESLTLKHGTRRETVKTNPPAMLPLKAVSHAPLALFALVQVADSKPLEPAQAATLGRLIDAIERAGQALASTALTKGERDQAGTILDRCRSWAIAARDQNRLSPQSFRELAHQLR